MGGPPITFTRGLLKIITLAGLLLALGLSACNGDDRPASSPVAPAAAPAPDVVSTPIPSDEARAAAHAETLLDWAESSVFGPTYFWPHAATQTLGPFRYRYYAGSGIYLGVVTRQDPDYALDAVYALGGVLGNQGLLLGRQFDILPALPAPPANSLVSFTPGRLTATFNEGDSPSLELLGTPLVSFSGTLYVVVEDRAQVLAAVEPVVINQQGQAVTRVRPRETLPLGLHEGTLQVHLCLTATCSSERPGSPVALPYRFGVVRQDPSLGFSASDAALFTSVPAGANGRLQVVATSSRWPDPPMHYRVIDPSGRVSGSGPLPAPTGGITRTLDLTVSLPEAPGRYDSQFQLQACRDRACSQPVLTSSFNYIAFREVAGLVDAALGATPELRPLRALPGAADWSGPQGNAAHSGYVPGTLDVARFGLRWHWALPEGRSYTLAPPAVAGARVALAAQGIGGNADTELFVLDEADGSLRWRRPGDVGSQAYFSAPALSASRLFSSMVLQDAQLGTVVMLRAFDLASGSPVFSTPVPTQWHASLPPVLAGARVLIDGGQGNGVASIDAASGQLQWRAGASGYTWWSPSFDGSAVYAYGSGGFWAYQPDTGATRFSSTDADLSNGYAAGPRTPAFAVDGGRAFVVDNGDLVVFDTRNGQVAWREGGRSHVGGTAAQGGQVVALQQGPLRVQARSAADGRLLWSYQPLFNVQGPDQSFVSEPLLTDNLVFISTDRGVYALSRSDGQPRWFYGRPGSLALSARGVLTIAHPGLPGQGGGVTAINLQ